MKTKLKLVDDYEVIDTEGFDIVERLIFTNKGRKFKNGKYVVVDIFKTEKEYMTQPNYLRYHPYSTIEHSYSFEFVKWVHDHFKLFLGDDFKKTFNKISSLRIIFQGGLPLFQPFNFELFMHYRLKRNS